MTSGDADDPFLQELQVSLSWELIAIGIATFYKSKCDIPDRLQHMYAHFYKAAYHRFYIDEFYLFITKRIIFNGVSRPIAWFDRHIIDGTMNGMAYITQRVSYAIRGLQSGQPTVCFCFPGRHFIACFISGVDIGS